MIGQGLLHNFLTYLMIRAVIAEGKFFMGRQLSLVSLLAGDGVDRGICKIKYIMRVMNKLSEDFYLIISILSPNRDP